MPTILPQGYTIFGGLKFGTPFVDDFQRRFDAIVGQVGAGQSAVGNALGQGNASRDFGQFGPPGGSPNTNPIPPGGGGGGTTGAGGLPAPPGGPTGGTGAQATSAGGGGGGGLPSPPGGGTRGTNAPGAGQSTGRLGGTNLNNRI
jgi:hypothetical protein